MTFQESLGIEYVVIRVSYNHYLLLLARQNEMWSVGKYYEDYLR